MVAKQDNPGFLVDVMVYERAEVLEIPVLLPDEMYDGNDPKKLKPGAHTMRVWFSDEEYHRFSDWSRKSAVLKIIGVHKKGL